MSKRTKYYWAIGILAIIIIIIWIVAARNTGNDRQNDGSISESSMDAPIHENMEHRHDAHQPGNENLIAYLEEQDIIMADMMEAMKNIPKSGNASIDFLKGMLPHHESAISMAESLLKYGGENEELKKIAEEIIEVQKTEIEQMKSLIQELETNAPKDTAKEDSYLKEYNKMFDNSHSHHMDTSNVQSVDQAFAEGMISHHIMAVDMSKAILDYTDQPEVKDLAENIIAVQEEEVSHMKEILKDLP